MLLPHTGKYFLLKPESLDLLANSRGHSYETTTSCEHSYLEQYKILVVHEWVIVPPQETWHQASIFIQTIDRIIDEARLR
jgi:hypothetical protein